MPYNVVLALGKVRYRSMKNNKAPGNDNITKEMIEACGDI